MSTISESDSLGEPISEPQASNQLRSGHSGQSMSGKGKVNRSSPMRPDSIDITGDVNKHDQLVKQLTEQPDLREEFLKEGAAIVNDSNWFDKQHEGQDPLDALAKKLLTPLDSQ